MTSFLRSWPALAAFLFGVGLAWAESPKDVAPADTAPPLPAMFEACDTNVAVAQDWLKQRDYKSLSDTAAMVQVLTGRIVARSDDEAWRQAANGVEAKIAATRTAAGKRDAEAARAALAELQTQLTAWSKLSPTGKPTTPVRSSANLKTLMLLVDGTYADARNAAREGDAKKAKSGAHVLRELSAVVSTNRSDRRWQAWCDELAKDSAVLAASDAATPETLAPLFRNVYRHCEACHNRR